MTIPCGLLLYSRIYHVHLGQEICFHVFHKQDIFSYIIIYFPTDAAGDYLTFMWYVYKVISWGIVLYFELYIV